MNKEKLRKIKTEPILGVKVAITNMNKTIQYITKNIELLRGQYICVANVHTTIMANRDSEYMRVQNSSIITIPDGKPLSMVLRGRGYKNAGRVAGPDLFDKLLEKSNESGARNYFYGTTEENLESLKTVIVAKYPNIQIAGMYSPPFRELSQDEEDDIVNRINRSKPDYVWVALGAPKQELWMNKHKKRIDGLMIGVGAAFNFTSGSVKRAPIIMQKLCMEWVYRAIQEPTRMIPRYASTNLAFIYNVVREELERRTQD